MPYKRYQKLQRYLNGQPVEPEEFIAGELLGDDYETLDGCYNQMPYFAANKFIAYTNETVRIYTTQSPEWYADDWTLRNYKDVKPVNGVIDYTIPTGEYFCGINLNNVVDIELCTLPSSLFDVRRRFQLIINGNKLKRLVIPDGIWNKLLYSHDGLVDINDTFTHDVFNTWETIDFSNMEGSIVSSQYNAYFGLFPLGTDNKPTTTNNFTKKIKFFNPDKFKIETEIAFLRFCNGLGGLTEIEGLEYYPMTMLGSITSMFAYCTKLQYVKLNIPEPLSSDWLLYQSAFRSCKSIETIDLSTLVRPTDEEALARDRFEYTFLDVDNLKTIYCKQWFYDTFMANAYKSSKYNSPSTYDGTVEWIIV